MSAEHFTREEGYEYFIGSNSTKFEADDWRDNTGLWHTMFGCLHCNFDAHKHWFRRKLPGPAQDGWVKFSDRGPRPEEYPIFVGNGQDHTVTLVCFGQACSRENSHWLTVTFPVPPKAPTQEECDKEAYDSFLKDKGVTMHGSHGFLMKDAFLAGAKHARDNK